MMTGMADLYMQAMILFTKKKKQTEHHTRPRRASATAPLRTGADTCETGSGEGGLQAPSTLCHARSSMHAILNT